MFTALTLPLSPDLIFGFQKQDHRGGVRKRASLSTMFPLSDKMLLQIGVDGMPVSISVQLIVPISGFHSSQRKDDSAGILCVR